MRSFTYIHENFKAMPYWKINGIMAIKEVKVVTFKKFHVGRDRENFKDMTYWKINRVMEIKKVKVLTYEKFKFMTYQKIYED